MDGWAENLIINKKLDTARAILKVLDLMFLQLKSSYAPLFPSSSYMFCFYSHLSFHRSYPVDPESRSSEAS